MQELGSFDRLCKRKENSFLTTYLDGIPALSYHPCPRHDFSQTRNYYAVYIPFQLMKACHLRHGGIHS